MARKYKTKINLNKRKKKLSSSKKYARKNKRSYASFGKGVSKNPIAKFIRARSEKFRKIAAIFAGVMFLVLIVGVITFLVYLKNITEELPSPDEPFGDVNEASTIVAAGGDDEEVLYSLFGEENREFLNIEEIPEHVKWAFIAAEDADFYSHPGVDMGGLIKAGMYEVFGIGAPRGGSTITQQLIKNTALSNERTYERKMKEILLSMAVERRYDKDQILEMYMNTVGMGSNYYGIKSAADLYFDKEVEELTIAEAAVLARIPQSPNQNSPTLATVDPENSEQRALDQRNYVLEQMRNNIDKINDYFDDKYGDDAGDYYIFEEDIEEAFDTEMEYAKPNIDINAPHFVFYVQQQLTTKGYNDGQPFELNDLRSGGYKIYTTLNMDIQRIAEEEVANGVDVYSEPRGGYNGAAVITDPKNGDIVAMVGSKDFNAESELDAEGKNLFDPEVNVTDTSQSIGSAMKPMAYYKAFELGIASPGSYLPDINIEIDDYEPQNWDRRFKGPSSGATPREQLRESRNTSAVILLNAMGLDAYFDELVEWGFDSIATNRSNLGYSSVLGGGDVTMIEAAEGYGVFANGGDLVELDPIEKIVRVDSDSDEEIVIYEKDTSMTNVADSRAVYMVNHILNYKNGGPPKEGIDGRDFSGKTGTTEDARDTIFAGYSPDFVIIGWNGNAENQSMAPGSWGENVTRPWVVTLAQRIAPFFPDKTPFSRPGGIISGNPCEYADIDTDDDNEVSCASEGQDFLIENKVPPAYQQTRTYRVCEDQPDKLAREIDEELGKAEDKTITVYRLPAPQLQEFLDEATSKSIPTEYCDIDRSPNEEGKPWAEFNSPNPNQIVSESFELDVSTYKLDGFTTKLEVFFDGEEIINTTDLPDYTETISVTEYEDGRYTIRARVYDNTGQFSDTTLNVRVRNDE